MQRSGKILERLIHVNSDPRYGQMRRFFLRAHLDEHTGDLAPIDLDVVGQFDRGFERKFVPDRLGNSFGCPNGESRGVGDVDLGSQQD